MVVTLALALAACGPRLGAVPTPTNMASPSICSALPTFGPAIDASYPTGVLQNQQGMVPKDGMDRLEPLEPAFEYFAAAGIANGTNIVEYALTQAGPNNAVVVHICRADGTVITANMYSPFPSASPPIWAVRSYRLGR